MPSSIYLISLFSVRLKEEHGRFKTVPLNPKRESKHNFKVPSGSMQRWAIPDLKWYLNLKALFDQIYKSDINVLNLEN